MKKLNWTDRKIQAGFLGIFMCLLLAGCTSSYEENAAGDKTSAEQASDQGTEDKTFTIEGESAEDGEIDFEALRELNPDIIGWVCIPGTDIDVPLLQNIDEDADYYSRHNAYGNSDDRGAAYIEYPNRPDFCDYNEVIFGLDSEIILRYMDPDFFGQNREIDIYIDGNKMTYTVVMARKWAKENILTRYLFNLGGERELFYRDALDTVSLSDNVADEFRNLDYTDFVITLVAELPDDDESQFIVLAYLTGDEAGSIKEPVIGIPGVTF